jgi:4-hydroxybenzoate polyprenyltransferase
MRKRLPIDILRGFFLLSHPGPVTCYMIAVAVYAILALWPNFSWRTFTLIVIGHLAMQLSISFFNDYCDRERDVSSKKYKPIVAGLVRPREALIATFVCMVVMVVLLLWVNPWALLVSLLYLALGQSYNLGLKATPLSGLVFALFTPLVPLYAFVGVERFIPLVFWQIPVVALMGVAFNLANSLPDVKEDVAGGARTLAVVLGERGSLVVCSLSLILAALIIVVEAITGLVPALLWPLLVAALFVCLAVLVLYRVVNVWRSSDAYKIYFYLVVSLCLVIGGVWIASVVM